MPSPNVQIEALQIVLAHLMAGHPSPRQALTQIDALIAEMQVNAETSPQFQAADPLTREVEEIRRRLGLVGRVEPI
jgi:hypothetical protein